MTYPSEKNVEGSSLSADHSRWMERNTVKDEEEASGPTVRGCGRQVTVCWDGGKAGRDLRKCHSGTFTNMSPDCRATQMAAELPEVSMRSSPFKTHSNFAVELRERSVQPMQTKEFYGQRFFHFHQIQTNFRSELKQIHCFVYIEYP